MLAALKDEDAPEVGVGVAGQIQRGLGAKVMQCCSGELVAWNTERHDILADDEVFEWVLVARAGA